MTKDKVIDPVEGGKYLFLKHRRYQVDFLRDDIIQVLGWEHLKKNERYTYNKESFKKYFFAVRWIGNRTESMLYGMSDFFRASRLTKQRKRDFWSGVVCEKHFVAP